MADWEIEQGIGLKTYVDPEDGKAADDVWGDVGNYSAGEYPTQNPPKLIERLIAASCPPDGLVMDTLLRKWNDRSGSAAAGKKVDFGGYEHPTFILMWFQNFSCAMALYHVIM